MNDAEDRLEEPATPIPDKTVKRDRVLFAIVALYLAFTFLRRLFPTDEWSSRSETMLRIAIDLALAIGLIGLGRRVLKALPRGTRGRGQWLFLFVAGLVSLLGILVIHMNGGQRLAMHPRFKAASVPALPADLNGMVSRVESLIAAYQKAEAEITGTRWARTSARSGVRELRALPREDLREYLAKQRAMLSAIDGMLEYLAKPGLADDFARTWSYAESQGLTAGRERPRTDPTLWRLLRRVWGPLYESHKIVEENWEEWRSIQSPTPEAQLKPWQRETKRLASEGQAAQKELAAHPDA